MSFKRVAFEGISGLPQLALLHKLRDPLQSHHWSLASQELAEAKELQLDQLDCTGTSPLAGYFKAQVVGWWVCIQGAEYMWVRWHFSNRAYHFSLSWIRTDALAGLQKAHDFGAVQDQSGSSGPWRIGNMPVFRGDRNTTFLSKQESMQHGKLLCINIHVCVSFLDTVRTSGHEPMAFGGATLFLEAPLHFNKLVEFHGNLSVIAVSQPLKGPCVYLRKDGVVKPGAELRLANCRRKRDEERFGGAMEVDGNLLIHGDLHIRNCSARYGGSLDCNWSQTGWTSDIIVFVSCVCAWNMSTQAELMWWGKIIVIPIDLQVGVVFSCIFFFGSPRCYESIGFPKPFGWKPRHLLGHRSHLRAEHLHPVEWQTNDHQFFGRADRRRGAPWSSSWGSFEMLLELALRLW